MITDDRLIHYGVGFLIAFPIIVFIVNRILVHVGVAHPLLYAVVGTPLVMWIIAIFYDLGNDMHGY